MGRWVDKTPNEVYSDAEILERLTTELPSWQLLDGFIQRRYDTSGWKGTLMVINAVGHLAEVAWHHPDLEASYNHVVIKLVNHAAKGITNKDFELAAKIEALVLWKPGEEGGALEGTPDDPRYQYLKY